MEMLEILGYNSHDESSVSSDDASSSSSSSVARSPPRLDWLSEEDEDQDSMYAQRRHRSAQRKILAKRKRQGRQDQVVPLRTTRTTPSDDMLLLGCAYVQIECCAWDADPLPVLQYKETDITSLDKKDFADQVVVAVETTAICGMDMAMRRGALDHHVPFPFVLGSNFVGIVHYASPEAQEFGIQEGDRVAAITCWGSNSRYVSASAENLMVVPKYLDAADMSCVISNYLPAFQMLHHGRVRPYRYTRRCLKGRRLLITGGATLEVQALIRMAHYAGATEIYVKAPRHDHKILALKDVVALDDDPKQWLPVVRGRMDLIVDYEFPRHFSYIQRALAPRGRLTCASPKTSAMERNWMSDLGFVWEYVQLAMMKRATLFDFISNIQVLNDDTEEDFHFLIKLLSTRQLRPHIDRFIKLSDVPKAHAEMEKQPLTGTIICEPWKE